MFASKTHRIFKLIRIMKSLQKVTVGLQNVRRDIEGIKLDPGKHIDIGKNTVMVSSAWISIVKEFNSELVLLAAKNSAITFIPAIGKFLMYSSMTLNSLFVLMITKKIYDNLDQETIDNLIKTLVSMKESVGKYFPSQNGKVREIFSHVGKKISESAGVTFTSLVETAKSAGAAASGGLIYLAGRFNDLSAPTYGGTWNQMVDLFKSNQKL